MGGWGGVGGDGGAGLKHSNLHTLLDALPKSANAETISAGMTRSVSMGNFSQKQRLDNLFGQAKGSQGISKNLNQYLSNSMEEEEDDNFF